MADPMFRMRAACVIGIGLVIASTTTARSDPATRIMRCTPINAEGFRTIEIYQDGRSDLGRFEVTPMRGDSTSEFVRLSITRDHGASYLQARSTDVAFTFLAKLGSDQTATLHFRVAGQAARLRFVCDSELTLAVR
jgi:hypothetical protein